MHVFQIFYQKLQWHLTDMDIVLLISLFLAAYNILNITNNINN